MKLTGKIIILVDVIIGIWWGVMWICCFDVMRHGGSIDEPASWIANIEFVLSIVITAWFFGQVIYWARKWL